MNVSRRIGLRLAGFAMSFALFAGSSAFAEEHPAARGPAVGQSVSFAATMTGSDNEPYNLADLHGANGTALVFSRSLNWCPFCKKQAEDLIDNAQLLTDAGYGIAIVTYDAPAKLAAYAAEKNPSFPLLSDPESQTIIAWGLRNEKYEPGSFAYGIPHPIIIVVDTDNQVVAKFAEEGYKLRPVLQEVAQSLTATN